MVEVPNFDFIPDKTNNSAGYLGLIGCGIVKMTHEQPEHGRVLEYGVDGELLGIEFLQPGIVDLTHLPQDETIPSEAKLVEIFNANNLIPAVSSDLIPE